MTENHPNGQWCWAELLAGDTRVAKSFYASLFGWTFRDDPIGGGMFYTMLFKEGLETGALYQLRKEQVEDGMSPHWMGYVRVESVDQTVAKALSQGATAVIKGMDVGTAGRMAYLQDPEGTVFCLWEPRDHPGIRASGPDTPGWFELASREGQKTADFYCELFGWALKHENPDGGSGYAGFYHNDAPIGGLVQMNESWKNIKPHWAVYLTVEDMEASVERASELGGGVMTGPSDMGNGRRFAVIQDPQGAVFSLIQ